MRVAVPKETYPGEHRVALVPNGAKELVKLGHLIAIEEGAADAAGYSEKEYRDAGANVIESRSKLLEGADVVLQVRGLGANPDNGRNDLDLFIEGQINIAQQDPLWGPGIVQELAQKGVTVLALETIPRISRAQSMDILSSQATIAGHKAVLVAAANSPKMFPMLMTAAGTISGAKVFVIGAGVAGLQAIATARRLGAVVKGYDIRPAAQEQIESLGAQAVQLDLDQEQTEDAGGYAKAQTDDFNQRQQEALAKVVAEHDVVVATAAIPGRTSPMLVTKDAVEAMNPGSVIVDLAAERGGNCELTLADELVRHQGVVILGPTDLPSTVARHASQMFSNNLVTLIKHLTSEGALLALDTEDEIVRDTMVAKGGEVLHPVMREKLGLGPFEQSPSENPTVQLDQKEALASTESKTSGEG